MFTKIRRGVFETNSSSSHSISISSEVGLMDTLKLNGDGDVELDGGEFGWDEESFNDAQIKASYLAIYSKIYYPDDEIGEDKLKDILSMVIQEQTGCDRVIFAFTSENAYIDHQSIDSQTYHYLFEDPEQLRQFIFNPNSYLRTDNDNH